MLILLFTACINSVITVDYKTCPMAIELDITEALPGEVVTITGDMSEDFDTSIRVGGANVAVVDFTRDECADCDSCRIFADCNECEACADCTATCASCVQTVTFIVPDVDAGQTAVVLANRYGTSDSVPFTVLAVDTGDDTNR